MSLTLSPIPPFPVLSDRAAGTYNSKGLAVHNHLANVFQPEMQAILLVVESAATASAAAIAAANYKGLWSSLSGALAIPATVFHNNARWMLTESVANVAAEVPGVSAKWAALSGTVELISTTTAAGVATVEWTNFDTLASTYGHLILQASNVLGSAATSTLTGQVRQSGAWQTATWVTGDFPSTAVGSTISLTNQLTNVPKQAMALEINVRQLGVTAVNHVDFIGRGGVATYPAFIGYSSFSPSGYTPTTPIQGLRINASTGNLTGTFRLYGVRK